MISQHSQTATLTVEVWQGQSTEGMVVDAIARNTLEEAIAKLQSFIALREDARERSMANILVFVRERR